MLPSTYRHLITVQGLLLSEDIETLVERNISSPGRDAQTEVPERLESDGFMIAVSAAQGGLELADKEIHQVRVVPSDVTLPRLHGLLAHAVTGGRSVLRSGLGALFTHLRELSISVSIGGGRVATLLTSS